jgi:excisionase family DNA binding protein
MNTTTSYGDWLTITQAGRYLNVSVAFLRKRVRTRSVPFARIGSKSLRFRRLDLDNWMEVNSSGGEISYRKDEGR